MKRALLILLLTLSICICSCFPGEAMYSNVQLVDDIGIPYGVPEIDGKPRVSSMSYLYDIVEGNVPGHEAWTKSGYNPNVGTASETVWSYSTAYVFPTAPIQMEVVSSDNTQDKAGGTGALEVYVNYLDGNYVEHQETIILNGTTAVPTVATNIFRVNNFRVKKVGAAKAPLGNLTIRGIGGGTVYSYITAGFNRARNIVYTVPAGKTLYVTTLIYSCADATKGVSFVGLATYDPENGGLTDFFLPFQSAILYNTSYIVDLTMPTRLEEKVDMKITAISAQAGAIAVASLRGWLETN